MQVLNLRTNHLYNYLHNWSWWKAEHKQHHQVTPATVSKMNARKVFKT